MYPKHYLTTLPLIRLAVELRTSAAHPVKKPGGIQLRRTIGSVGGVTLTQSGAEGRRPESCREFGA